MNHFAAIGASLSATLFAFLLALLVTSHRGNPIGRSFIFATLASTIWLVGYALYSWIPTYFVHSFAAVVVLEVVRDAGWLMFLVALIRERSEGELYSRLRKLIVACIALQALSVTLVVATSGIFGIAMEPESIRKIVFSFLLLNALGVVLLVEQVFRNASNDGRWSIKHLCLALIAIHGFDFYLYADAVLFRVIDGDIWSARTVVNGLVVPLLAITAVRNRQWDLDIFVSRRVVFHTVSVSIAGLYLLAVSGAGYYLQLFGGDWGGALRTSFLVFGVLLLATLISSTQLRSRLRLFLSKHFYRNKYEYGEQWLNFTQRLATAGNDLDGLDRTILLAVCDVLDSPGGVLWKHNEDNRFVVAAAAGGYSNCDATIFSDDPIFQPLARGEIVDVVAGEAALSVGEVAPLPSWLLNYPQATAFVPIVHGEELLAVLLLARSRSLAALTAEDHDLLNTLGRQAASYLALIKTSEALSEAEQFETFNRLSAFLVHDLKNVIAQLSLIVTNAERHRHRADFVEDAFLTVGDAVEKMNRMLASLKQIDMTPKTLMRVDLCEVAGRAVERKCSQVPQPAIDLACEQAPVHGNEEQLQSVIEHLLQNAVEATPGTGEVLCKVRTDEQSAVVEIRDTGSGMDQEFLERRLFKPFDTTKGKAGMGIGAYESRHIVNALGGQLLVRSDVGKGSVFSIVLPLSEIGEQVRFPVRQVS
ncbi:MAG: XrtA/PEP-CTERM system histidine kinase PrsK [Pseudomonadota bacterium]